MCEYSFFCCFCLWLVGVNSNGNVVLYCKYELRFFDIWPSCWLWRWIMGSECSNSKCHDFEIGWRPFMLSLSPSRFKCKRCVNNVQIKQPPPEADSTCDLSIWHHCYQRKALEDIVLKGAWDTDMISFAFWQQSHDHQRVTVWPLHSLHATIYSLSLSLWWPLLGHISTFMHTRTVLRVYIFILWIICYFNRWSTWNFGRVTIKTVCYRYARGYVNLRSFTASIWLFANKPLVELWSV